MRAIQVGAAALITAAMLAGRHGDAEQPDDQHTNHQQHRRRDWDDFKHVDDRSDHCPSGLHYRPRNNVRLRGYQPANRQ
ncbi:MAG: hypothetical protein JOZ15_19410 [Acidobacteria bacterium]|nr:hypothetical protein [Acidobacteriota bacterium]